MKHWNRKRLLSFTFIIMVMVAGLCYASYQWQQIHHSQPMVAYYALASAMEQENQSELVRLAPRGVAAELYKLAKPYGGIRRMGKLLRESPEVSPFTHVPLASIEVIAKIRNKRLLILFARRRDRYVATAAFFAD